MQAPWRRPGRSQAASTSTISPKPSAAATSRSQRQ